MSAQLFSVQGNTYVGFNSDDIITRIPHNTPESNLYNHSAYPSIQDMVDHATGDPWDHLGNTGLIWRGATGSDQLFMAAVQAYHSHLRRSSRDSLHPTSLEWDTLIDMATLDNCDPPPLVLKQAFRHAAGLAVNLLEVVDDQTKCHHLLAGAFEEWKKEALKESRVMRRLVTEGDKKVRLVLLMVLMTE